MSEDKTDLLDSIGMRAYKCKDFSATLAFDYYEH